MSRDLPNIAEIVGPILQRLPAAERPLLIALAERLAAERYRGWAAASGDTAWRAALFACAAREENIAARVEALYADAAATQARMRHDNPDLERLNQALFAGRPIEEQYAIQAAAERVGAATWRAFAAAAAPPARETFLACADLEEESARVLESRG
jgi:hypothetical protein